MEELSCCLTVRVEYLGVAGNMFEKHVAVDTSQYPKNGYSATPDNIEQWLQSMLEAYQMCGIRKDRHNFSDKEIADLRQFRRGVFAKQKIEKGDSRKPYYKGT